MTIDRSKERIREIHEALLDEYGKPEPPAQMSGMEYIIETILSQNTTDEARDKAFATLMEEFDSYEDIEDAPTEDVADAIRVCGLGPTKAERIQGALAQVRSETGGEYSTAFIDELSIQDSMEWLTDINGIGAKTAALVLCFHFRKPIMPVDTHVERIAKRFELAPHSASAAKTQNLLNNAVPDEIKYDFHMLLIEHGRTVCSARNPSCEQTSLRKFCSYHDLVIEGSLDSSEYPPET